MVATRRIAHRKTDAYRHRADALELERCDPLDDRCCRPPSRLLRDPREEERELVAAEPERLAALAQPRRDLGQHAVSDRVTEPVVHELEVVDVGKAESELSA